MTKEDVLANRIDATKRSWLPIAGHVVNITFSLEEADMISAALRRASMLTRGETLRMVAGLFADSAHETYTREEVVSIVEDMIRIGQPVSLPRAQGTGK